LRQFFGLITKFHEERLLPSFAVGELDRMSLLERKLLVQYR
jgi:hypothetical protein